MGWLKDLRWRVRQLETQAICGREVRADIGELQTKVRLIGTVPLAG